MSTVSAPKKKNAVLTVLSMAAAMVLSKGLGMVRSMCMASAYGTGYEANAFSAASRIPLSFFDLLFSAAILGCFIPVYNSFRGGGNSGRDKAQAERDADTFACIFLNFILLFTSILSVIGILFAPQLIALITPELPSETAALAASLLRIMFPMILFTGAAYTLVGILQSKEHFFLPSMISAISNLGVILYFLLLNDRLGEGGVYGLAVAYLCAWALQFITLAIPLAQMRFPYRLLLDFHNPALRRALKMTPPIMLGSWLSPLSLLIGTHFASGLTVDGAVTVFEYAVNIGSILTGILTYGICNFTFPRLSRMNVSGEETAFSSTARAGILSALAIVLPVTAAVLCLSEEGTALLYLRGAFTAEDTLETARALRYYALGMPAFCLTEIISRVMYARMSVYVPMAASLAGAAVNLVSAAVLSAFCGEVLGVGCVTLAASLGQWTCALVLIIALLRTVPGILSRDFGCGLAKLFLLTLLSGGIMAGISALLANNAVTAGFFGNLIVCAAVFVPAAVVYLAGLKILRVRFV